eukprot:1394889-Amorphochlora_amoeboformis.AAC.2
MVLLRVRQCASQRVWASLEDRAAAHYVQEKESTFTNFGRKRVHTDTVGFTKGKLGLIEEAITGGEWAGKIAMSEVVVLCLQECQN